jgi:hypothetical protein
MLGLIEEVSPEVPPTGSANYSGVDDEHRERESPVGDCELLVFWAFERPGWVVALVERGIWGVLRGIYLGGVGLGI